MSPARRSRNQGLISHPTPAHRAFLSRKASGLDRPLSENSSGKTGEEYDDFPMSEAGPSGVCHHSPSVASPRTVNLDESLSARHSSTTVTVRQDLPPRSSPMPLLDDADGHDQYGFLPGRPAHPIKTRL